MAEGMTGPVDLEPLGVPFPYDDWLQTHRTCHPHYGQLEDEKCSDMESEYIGSADDDGDDAINDDNDSESAEEALVPELEVEECELGAECFEATC